MKKVFSKIYKKIDELVTGKKKNSSFSSLYTISVTNQDLKQTLGLVSVKGC